MSDAGSPSGEFAFDQADEDVHSAIERGVTDRLGDVGARLHAGRSRNDLVVTDLRMWILAAGRRIDGLITMLVRTLVARASEQAETVMPGTTHARPRSPSRSAITSWRTRGRCSATSSASTSAAVRTSRRRRSGPARSATSTLGLDPAAYGGRLGSAARSTTRSTPCRDRDFVPGVPGDAAICATHLSRLAADSLVDRSGVGWAELDEATRPGRASCRRSGTPIPRSSRAAKAGRLAGRLSLLRRCCRVCRSATTATSRRTRSRRSTPRTRSSSCLPAMVGAVDSMRFDGPAMRAAAAEDGLYAPTSPRRSCAAACRSARRTGGPGRC